MVLTELSSYWNLNDISEKRSRYLMDPQDPSNKPPTTGKVRVSHGGRNRAKPYARKKVKKPTEDLPQADAEKV